MGRLASFKDSENRLTVERLRCTCLLRFSPCYKSGGATFTDVEERKRRYHTRCNVANRTSRPFAHLIITHNFLKLKTNKNERTHTIPYARHRGHSRERNPLRNGTMVDVEDTSICIAENNRTAAQCLY